MHEQILHNGRAQDYAQEQKVVKEPMENVVLFGFELAGVDLVEELEEDEGVEDDGVVLGFLGWGEGAVDGVDDIEGYALVVGVAEEAVALEEEDDEHGYLEEPLSEDVSPHNFGHNALSTLVGRVI